MSTVRKSIVFLAVAFAISWAIAIGGWAMGLHRDPQMAVLVLATMMTGPAISALICAFAFEKGRRTEALGLKFRPNWWWLFAWLIVLALAVLAVVATALLSGQQIVDIGETIIAQTAAQAPQQADALRAIPQLGLVTVAMAAVVGGLINTPILTFTEELGWRGYLHDLWRPSGFWRASLATGFVWGLWHAPAIVLYGLNYPDNAGLGIVLFTAFCMLMSPILTLVRERGGSVWAAGIFHGTFNAVGSLTLAALSNPVFPWNGIVGVGGFVALAAGVAGVYALRRGEDGAAGLVHPPPVQ